MAQTEMNQSPRYIEMPHTELRLVPVTADESKKFFTRWVGQPGYAGIDPSVFREWRFIVGVKRGNRLVAVGHCIRPILTSDDNGATCELWRVDSCDGIRTGRSMEILYEGLRDIALRMGYLRIVTYFNNRDVGRLLERLGFEQCFYTETTEGDRLGRYEYEVTS